jgi:RNA polymerase sigma factor (sigma-70 family)
MDIPPINKTRKHRVLTQAAFDQLLAHLHEDRASAAEKYEHLRQALITFFAFRGATDAGELADETINRVAGRLTEGAAVFTGDPASYFFGVARNVWREMLARPVKLEALDETLPPGAGSTPDPHTLLLETEHRAASERRLGCLEKCLQGLPPQDREMIVEYYQGTGGEKIESRQALADRFGISLKTLRNKTTLLRTRISDCLRACLESNDDIQEMQTANAQD